MGVLLFIVMLAALLLLVFGGFTSAGTFAKQLAVILGLLASTITVMIAVTIVEVCMGVHHVDLGNIMPPTLGIMALIVVRFFVGKREL